MDETIRVYKEAAESPSIGLCCTSSPVWSFPGLTVPKKMLEMNYGCGSTVHPRDLLSNPSILYVGVGGGMELLQFSYFSRIEGKVIGVDIVDEMLQVCKENLDMASEQNDWFDPKFVQLKKGSALDLPIANQSIDVAAQNCLFNIFKQDELHLAVSEMYRVLKPGGRLILSDPISNTIIPEKLRNDAHLRALCLSGALPLDEYLLLLTSIGFGTIEVRAKYPYRMLSSAEYEITENILVESVEICAIKDPVPEDGPCIFTGKSAIYFGLDPFYDDHQGHVLLQNQPLPVCDKTASNLELLGSDDILITPSTYFYNGGGCC